MTNEEIENKFKNLEAKLGATKPDEVLNNRIKILEQKSELKELDNALKEKRSLLKVLFSKDNAAIITAIIGGVISLIVLFIQKQSEINLEREKFADVIIQKVIDKDSTDQSKIQSDLIFYSKLGLIDISRITKDTIIEGIKTSVFTIDVPTASHTGGVQKWDIKVLNDIDGSKINFDKPEQTTIKALSGLNVKFNASAPRFPEEMKVYKIKCKIVSVKNEMDADYELVISDNDGNSMIGEIPDPENPQAVSSGHQNEYKECRQIVDDIFGKEISTTNIRQSLMKDREIEAIVTGVGFIDLPHHQTGVSPNGFELHPILKIELGNSN